MNWKELHFDSTVVDLHTHPTLKSLMFHRNLGGKKQKLLSRFFKEKFWPFSARVTFPKMEQGGMDVMLATAYILEQGWIDDISLIDWLLWFTPSVRKKIVDPPDPHLISILVLFLHFCVNPFLSDDLLIFIPV